MKSLFRWTHEEGHFSNSAAKIKEPKLKKRILKYLTDREIEHLRDASLTPMEKALFEFMFSTGGSIGEIVTLDMISVNWSNHLHLLRGKVVRKGKYILIFVVTFGLKIYIESREDNDDDDAIFVTERQPHRMSKAKMIYH